MAAKRHPNESAGRDESGERAAGPPGSRRLRLPLRTLDDVKAEMARLYRSAKAGAVPVGDASKLANILAVLGRLIEVSPTSGGVPITDGQSDRELLSGVDINDPVEVAKILADIGRRAAARSEEPLAQGGNPFAGWPGNGAVVEGGGT